ncbi:MAG: head GIN domain-containing protein [Blastomonas sp.]
MAMISNMARFAAIMAGTAMLSACGGLSKAEEMVIGGDDADKGETSWSGEAFDRIVLAGPDNLEFTVADSHAVTASGDAKALEQLRFRVKDGELRIARKKGSWSLGDDGKATIRVSAPALVGLMLAGSGDAKVDRMQGEDLRVSIAGSGDLDVASVTARSLKGDIAGSGRMRLGGTAHESRFSIAGSGDMDGDALTSDEVSIKIAGSGNIRIKSDGKVNAKLMGSGDVVVDGKAQCSTRTMGSGSLRCG